MTNVLILGGRGFLGAAVARRFGTRAVASSRAGGPGMVRLDPSDFDELNAAVTEFGITTIINASGLKSGTSAELETANVTVVTNTLRLAEIHGLRLVHIGSAAEYGALSEIVDETADCEPLTPYARTKLRATDLVVDAASSRVDCVSARVFNVVGPSLSVHQPVGEFAFALTKADHTATLTIRNAATCRDFVPRSFVVSALQRLCTVSGPLPPIVNICSGVGVTFGALATAMAEYLGLDLTIDDLGEPLSVVRMVGSTTLLRKSLGIEPPTDLMALAAEAFHDPSH